MFKTQTKDEFFNSTDEGDGQALEQQQAADGPGSSSPLQRAAAHLDWLCWQVRMGAIAKKDLVRRARLSKDAVIRHLAPFGVRSDSSLISNVETYRALRALKFEVEGLNIPLEDVPVVYCSDIEEVRRFLAAHPALKGVTSIRRQAPELHRRLSVNPCNPVIYRLAGLESGRLDLMYWTDEELLRAAEGFGLRSDLKSELGEVHRHIKGRGLDAQLVLRYPEMFRHVRIGLGGHVYRSTGELVVGNWCALNEIEVEREKCTGLRRPHSNKPMVADFYFPGPHLWLEISQNRASEGGGRLQTYAARTDEKEACYEDAGFKHLFVDTQGFFDHGAFMVDAFAKHLVKQLASRGFDLGAQPAAERLIYEDNEIKRQLATLGTEDVIRYLQELGAIDTRTLCNNFSAAVTCLKLRIDFPQIKAAFKRMGLAARSSTNAATWAAKRKDYAPIEVVQELCKKFNITSQRAWHEFAAANPKVLAALRIPSNPYAIYRNLGSWVSWTSLWPRRAVDD